MIELQIPNLSNMNNFVFLIRSLVIFLLTLSFSSSAQTVEIGQSAQNVKNWAQLTAEELSRSDSYGNSSSVRAQWDVKYFNGRIDEVILCINGIFDTKSRKGLDLCNHYIMKDDLVESIIVQYKNLSLDEVVKKYSDNRSIFKIDKYYFKDGYKLYSTIYLHENGLATVETRRADDGSLPNHIFGLVEDKVKASKEVIRKKEIELQEKEKIKKEKLAKVYNLEVYSQSEYKKGYESQRDDIIRYLSDINNANAFILEQGFDLKQRDSITNHNVYKVTHYIEGDSKETINHGSHIEAGSSGSLTSDFKAESVSGTDKKAILFKKLFRSGIDPLVIDGEVVKTKATYTDVSVNLSLGTTIVKIKDNKIKFAKNIPTIESQKLISEKLKDSKGRYSVKYVTGNVMDKDFATISKTKKHSPGRYILAIIGIIVLIEASSYL